MSLSLSQIQDQIQVWALRKFPEDVIGGMDDTEMLNLFNQVAEDFNVEAGIRRERYYMETTAGETNYELQGVIREIYLFKYHDTDFETQYYSYVNDTIVLKNSPGGDVLLDIHYLRATEVMANPADEVDLPDVLLLDYMDLIKKRMEVEYGDVEDAVYMTYLREKGKVAGRGRHVKSINDGVMRHWGTYATDDSVYDITSQWVGQDSLAIDVDGHYFFIS